jgi:hypothetical protein
MTSGGLEGDNSGSSIGTRDVLMPSDALKTVSHTLVPSTHFSPTCRGGPKARLSSSTKRQKRSSPVVIFSPDIGNRGVGSWLDAARPCVADGHRSKPFPYRHTLVPTAGAVALE